jgi:acyl CoA:acetate/3-ketoacid CoA transferase beta subunit
MMTKKLSNYNQVELMASVAAKMLEDDKSVLVGTGLPVLAAMLAQRINAPNILIMYEAGGVGSQASIVPVSVGESRTFYHGIAASSMHDVMSALQGGFVDYGFLGAAQIDIYGNINTTVIGDYDSPKVRLPGSGGANDAGSLCFKTIILMKQDTKRFVKKIDFITTPGYLTGPGAREKAGLPQDTGPYRVITQLGVYGFDNDTKKMTLISTHPNVSIEEIKENCSFELIIPEDVETSEEPSDQELKILRKIDPMNIVIGK